MYILIADKAKRSQSSLYVSASPANADSEVKINYNRDPDN